MCGRYTLYARPQDVIRDYRIGKLKAQLEPSYNIAPSQLVNVVIAEEQKRVLTLMRWGLIPHWHKTNQKIPMLHNARLETVDIKPSFRNAFRRRRCLILADGFYEWDQKTKQPYYIQTQDRKTFAMAGIWERWHADDETIIESCSIITQPANPAIAAYHDRMPVILLPIDYSSWLSNEVSTIHSLKSLLVPLPDGNTTIYPVDKRVNTPKFNNKICIEKIID